MLTDTVEEQRPSVADDPAVEVDSPRSREHDLQSESDCEVSTHVSSLLKGETHQTERHDEGVLDETELPSDPISLESDKDLTDDDTQDLKVLNGVDPPNLADDSCAPAGRPDGLEERLEISDREEGRSLGEETHTGDDISLYILSRRRQGVLQARR